MTGLHALKRVAKPEEIARSARYLASDDSSFVEGTASLAHESCDDSVCRGADARRRRTDVIVGPRTDGVDRCPDDCHLVHSRHWRVRARAPINVSRWPRTASCKPHRRLDLPRSRLTTRDPEPSFGSPCWQRPLSNSERTSVRITSAVRALAADGSRAAIMHSLRSANGISVKSPASV